MRAPPAPCLTCLSPKGTCTGSFTELAPWQLAGYPPRKRSKGNLSHQGTSLGSFTRKLPVCVPQGTTEGRETHAQSRRVTSGRYLLVGRTGGQSWLEHRIPYAKAPALSGSCGARLSALGRSCFAAAPISPQPRAPPHPGPTCRGRMG